MWYSDARKNSTNFEEKSNVSESGQVAHRKKTLGGQKGKIMGKLKYNYNKLPELKTKLFYKQCVILSFPPTFNEFHHKLHIFKIIGTILEKLKMRKKVTTAGIWH